MNRVDKMTTAKYIFIIAALSCAIYANTLHNDFVSDDIPAIIANPFISSFSHHLDSLASFTEYLDYSFGKFNPVVYHLTNIALHILSSILVFFFLRLFFKPLLSFWGALIFAAHPVHAEAVTWISGRGYLIHACLVLASFLLYVSATGPPRLKKFKFIVSLVLYVLALYTETIALLFPVLLVFYDGTFGRWRKNWKLWLTFFALSSFKFLLITTLIKERASSVAVDIGPTGMTNPVFNMVYSIFAHLGLLIWPQKLTLYHEPYNIAPLTLGIEVSILVLLILSLPLIFKKAKVLFFAIGFFVLFLAPTYSPIVISWLVAERYLYLSSVALSIFCVFLIERFAKTKKLKICITVFLILLIAVYSLRTVVRNRDWKNHATIWRATAKVSPLSPKAHNNMGDVWSLEGDLDKAAEEFKRATELKPNYADAYHNLANTYQKMGKFDEAIENYKKAISFNPALYQSYQNLGVIYFNRGEKESAKGYFEKALEINPDNAQLHRILEEMER